MKIDWRDKARSVKWAPRKPGDANLRRRHIAHLICSSFWQSKRRCEKIKWEGLSVSAARPPISLVDLLEEARPAAEMLDEHYNVEEIAEQYGVPFDLMLLKIDEWALRLPAWFKGWFPESESA